MPNGSVSASLSTISVRSVLTDFFKNSYTPVQSGLHLLRENIYSKHVIYNHIVHEAVDVDVDCHRCHKSYVPAHACHPATHSLPLQGVLLADRDDSATLASLLSFWRES